MKSLFCGESKWYTATSLFKRNIRHSRRQERYLVDRRRGSGTAVNEQTVSLRRLRRKPWNHCLSALWYGTRRTTRENVMRSMARSVAPSVIINRLRNSPLSWSKSLMTDRLNGITKICTSLKLGRWNKREARPFISFIWTYFVGFCECRSRFLLIDVFLSLIPFLWLFQLSFVIVCLWIRSRDASAQIALPVYIDLVGPKCQRCNDI